MGNTYPHKWWRSYEEECATPPRHHSDPSARTIAVLAPGESADYCDLRVTLARDGGSATLELFELPPIPRWTLELIGGPNPMADILAEIDRMRSVAEIAMPAHVLHDCNCQEHPATRKGVTAYACARCNERFCWKCGSKLDRWDDSLSIKTVVRWCPHERCQREEQIERGILDVVPRVR